MDPLSQDRQGFGREDEGLRPVLDGVKARVIDPAHIVVQADPPGGDAVEEVGVLAQQLDEIRIHSRDVVEVLGCALGEVPPIRGGNLRECPVLRPHRDEVQVLDAFVD